MVCPCQPTTVSYLQLSRNVIIYKALLLFSVYDLNLTLNNKSDVENLIRFEKNRFTVESG